MDDAKSQAPTEVKKRIVYLDILNIIACISVVALHCNSIVHWYKPDFRSAWSQSLVIEVVFFFAVPVFLMLSGSTLLEYRKRYDTKTFFKRRLSRVVIPFIIWSIITYFWALHRGTIEFWGIRDTWDIFMSSRQMSIYWYFPVIISAYFAVPILSLFVTEMSDGRKYLRYLFFAGTFSYGVCPLLAAIANVSYNSGYNFPLIGTGGYILYIILGYLLYTTEYFKERKRRLILYIAAMACLAFRYFMMYRITISSGDTYKALNNYVYLIAIIPSAAVFVVAKHTNWDKTVSEKAANALTTVASCSLGIYLIHRIILPYEESLFGVNKTSAIYRLAFIPLTYVACLVLVWVVKKVPVIGKYVFP